MSSALPKEAAPAMVGKRCVVFSYRVKNAAGTIKSYIWQTHSFWVILDEPIVNRGNGKLSTWHKCNAGNVTIQNG